MAKRGRPTAAASLEAAWRTIRNAGADGAQVFDIKAVLVAIASDPGIAATPRISALKLLREIEIAEANARAIDAAMD
jgi:hypothetical protein